jgi:hypothetical protein
VRVLGIAAPPPPHINEGGPKGEEQGKRDSRAQVDFQWGAKERAHRLAKSGNHGHFSVTVELGAQRLTPRTNNTGLEGMEHR